MKGLLSTAAIGAAFLLSASAAMASELYHLDVTSNYGSSYHFTPATNIGSFGPSPDTGFVTFINSGSTQFVGTIGDVAVSPSAGDESQSFSETLNPGQAVYFAVDNESSNVGGFNGGLGVTIFANGTWGGVTTRNLSVNDADIHSGVFRSANGTQSDSFILQGGDPLGGDTGDAFETTQTGATHSFIENSAGVPEPASWALMLTGFFGMGAAMRGARKAKGAAA